MENRRIERWERVLPIRHKDNIVSSQFSDSPKFVASYENEDVDMFTLMSHNYGRKWLEEKDIMKQVILETFDDDFLMRRYVIRGQLNRKKEVEKQKKMKEKYRNIPAKVHLKAKPSVISTETRSSATRPIAVSKHSSTLGEIANDSLLVVKQQRASQSLKPVVSSESSVDETRKVHFIKPPSDAHVAYEIKSKCCMLCDDCYEEVTGQREGKKEEESELVEEKGVCDELAEEKDVCEIESLDECER